MRQFIQAMKALSDPSRVAVLKILEQGELCVCEIQHLLGLAQPTVSKHMKILEEAGLVKRRREGTWILYSLSAGEESPYAQTMLTQLKDWLQDDPGVRKMIQLLPEAAALRSNKNS
ncbi:MAG: metalloregulator ArsR/SmtB family transcription factor [Candidatus Electrothrix sp. GW3-4]|uniref:ArsR/SmtB family transcription factor n=1 Tax=Candidatus Electrothrix sp. GW3-4 TaxID=3126740 RepID=UPI0030CB523A